MGVDCCLRNHTFDLVTTTQEEPIIVRTMASEAMRQAEVQGLTLPKPA